VSNDQAVVLVGIEAFFAHPRLAPKLLPPAVGRSLIAALSGATGVARTKLVANLEHELAESLRNDPPPDLSILWLRNRHKLEPGLLVTCDQTLTITGLASAERALSEGKSGRARFSGRLVADDKVQIMGTLNAEHLTSSSASEMLTGRRRRFVLAYLTDVEANGMVLRPAVIGQRIFRLTTGEPSLPSDPLFLHSSMIDAFAGVDWSQPVSSSDLGKLRNLPEQAVKQAFADIIGEPVVPHDWGGERSDLWTARLRIGGIYWSAAFLFKGPAKFAPMTIAMLGKNGDQIDRLASEPADILVVQHCHNIRSEVRNMLRVYAAADWKRPRRCLAIDGYDTVKILRHFGRLESPS
jgi:hypothetical protein